MAYRQIIVGLFSVCLPLCLVAQGEEPAAVPAAASAAGSCGDSLAKDPCDCDGCACKSFDCCDCFNDRRRLLGMLPSDHCFDNFISPLSNPFFFEDPRSLTEARGIFIENSLPGFTGGGDLQVWAGQVRGRLTDRLSVIAPRLGYLQVNQSGGGAPAGFMSAPVGFKYNFIRDVDRQFLVSGGMTYFIPGSQGALANFGSGDYHFFLTAGKEIFGSGHWLSATGFRIPADPSFGTQLWYWSNQWDYRVSGNWYALTGINWYHFMTDSKLNFPAPVTGLDLLNLPVTGVAGTNVTTCVVGTKWKPSGHFELGGGFEFPLSNRTDILHNRLYADVIFRY